MAAKATTYTFSDNCNWPFGFGWRGRNSKCADGVADADCFWSYPQGSGPRSKHAKCRELPDENKVTDNAGLVFDTTADGLSMNHSKGLCLLDCPTASDDKECRFSYVSGEEGDFTGPTAMYRCMDVVPDATYVDEIAMLDECSESNCAECVLRTYTDVSTDAEFVCVDTAVYQYRNECTINSFPWRDKTKCASDALGNIERCFLSYPVGDQEKWLAPDAACRTLPASYDILPAQTTFAANPKGKVKGLCETYDCEGSECYWSWPLGESKNNNPKAMWRCQNAD